MIHYVRDCSFFFTEWVRSHTVGLGSLIRNIMFLGIGMGWLQLTEAQQALWLAVVSSALDLFISKQTIAANKVDKIVDKAIERSDKINEVKIEGK